MKRRKWSVEHEEMRVALADVYRSGIGGYYRIIDGKCKTVSVIPALKDLGMCGTIASRILSKFPFPVIPFQHNRKQTVLTEDELEARRMRKTERALAKAIKAVSISDGLRGNSFQGVTP
jgi:hypothetical protein